MYKLAYMSNRWLCVEIDESDCNDITFMDEYVLPLVLEGAPILIVEELDDLPKDLEYERVDDE